MNLLNSLSAVLFDGDVYGLLIVIVLVLLIIVLVKRV